MQAGLVLSFIAFVLISAGVAGYVSQRSGRQAVQELASRLRSEMTAHIVEHVQDFLHTPHTINRLNADALSEGVLDANDERMLELHFRQQIEVFSTVFSIYFGNTRGGLVNGGREPPDDSRYVIGTAGGEAGLFRKYSIDKDGNRLSLLAEVPDFDARTRGWYTRALKIGGATWSDVYVLFTGQDMAITASRPVYGAGGDLLGVAAVDLSLSQLSGFLETLPLGQGTAFIMDRSGQLVASSGGGKPFVVSEGGCMRRLQAVESTHPGVRAAAAFLYEKHVLEHVLQDGEHAFETEGGLIFLRAVPLSGNEALDWIIVVATPESEFMGWIDENNRTTTLIILFAVFLSCLAGFAIARRMSLPILRLNDAARAIARSETPPGLPIDCGIVEVGELSVSFNRMAETLRRTIHGLNEEIAVRQEAELRARSAMERAEELRKDAESANRAKSEFLANMSHEIRTPLNGVIGFLEILRGTGLDREQIGYVDNAKVSAFSLLEIISNILDISKIEAGKLELETIRTDISRLMEETLVIVGHGAMNRGVRIFSTLSPAFPRYAFVDPVRLRQVLVNLLGNAVKFTDEGDVELSASFLPDRSGGGRGAFTFSVRDTGIGIRKEDRDKLFQPFSQADASNTRKYGGTGLGLVISNGILREMGSSLELESEPGKGSRFYFTIAARYEEGDSFSDESKTAMSGGNVSNSVVLSLRPCTILVVEDLRMNRTLLRLLSLRMLPSATILEAENGEQAVELFRKHSPDIVFMDMHMPKKNGCEAAVEIREIEKSEGRRAPVIALTADVLAETRERCFQAGMDAFLAKPVEADTLRAILERYLAMLR